jgi:hypothetical protein|tara:strand:- start:1511 stop:1750 length:240 start_codon:yes stop_codon:yes gene_type:complete
MNLYIIIYFLLFSIFLHLLLYFFNIDIFELFEKNEEDKKKIEEIKKDDNIEEKDDINSKNDIINDLVHGIQQLKDIDSI